MQSPEILDFSEILSPISDENPGGEDPRTVEGGGPARLIRTARDESYGVEKQHRREPGKYALSDCRWDEVIALSTKFLAEAAKDYDIAAFLCEALLREQGYAGLRDGFRLARQMSEHFWDNMYPEPRDGDYTTRVRMLKGLFQNNVLVIPIKEIPLTEGRAFTQLDYEQAHSLADVTDPDDRRDAIGAGRRDVTVGQFQQDARDSSIEFYQLLFADLNACLDELGKLDETLKEQCGEDSSGQPTSPPVREVADALRDCIGTVETVAGDRLAVAAPDQSSADEEQTDDQVSRSGISDRSDGQELTRESALAKLRELAEFFQQTEPHSPVSYHIHEAVRWGKMALPELLSELIADEESRNKVFKRVGIKQPDDED
jgi:type VI secretion system protein ImpA